MIEYKTINNSSQSTYKQYGSVFLGFIKKINSIKDFKVCLKINKLNHKSASHVCSAYRIINQKILEEKASDDGEPSGSAGIPMLNELKRNNIINIGVYVVRYFGGRKLGIPGLICAYSETIKLALLNNKLVPWETSEKYTLNYNYADIDYIDFLIKKYKITLHDRIFDLFVNSIVEINNSLFEKFKNELKIKNSNRISIRKIK